MRDAAAYVDWFYRHLPKGPVWPVDQQSTPVWHSLLEALSLEPARVDAFVFGILSVFIPAPTMGPEMLDVWEAFLGLTPQASDTTSTRALAILALLGQYISPTLDNLQDQVDLFGNSAVVSHLQYHQFEMGVGVMGDTLRGDQWMYTWAVTYDAPQSDTFEAAVRAVMPLHTTLIFVVTP